MSDNAFPHSFAGLSVHLVGIKGTGMSALAEILQRMGARLSGSDTEEHFYTDEILNSLRIPFAEGFASQNLPESTRLVIHSAAYNRDDHPELLAAKARGIPIASYNEALGELSRRIPSSGISGVHGKTTTTAMTGIIVKELELTGVVLAGSAVAGFGGRSTLFRGLDFFVAETCEYRRHFLAFSPRHIVLTSVEPDHLDYFRDLEDITQAFVEYALRLPDDGALIYCADDAGASTVAERVAGLRPGIRRIPYGESAEGLYRIEHIAQSPGSISFRIPAAGAALELHVPGRHNVLNATAAIALTRELLADRHMERNDSSESMSERTAGTIRRALADFRGSRRRCEIVGEVSGILVIDDYGHHPTAIAKTLEGIAAFYPGRRIVVDFMSHTYSRTEALLEQFGRAFAAADLVITHRIYASAREAAGSVTGEDLAAEIRRNRPNVRYFPEPLDALPSLVGELRNGDIFVTMGAGDNWKLGRALLTGISGRDGEVDHNL
ncbi:MAG TPA: UDP-N-acetylmuramate--L-alanine ligase [Spirochaetia bacterium]|nr:UDP-N-acetylmuramate--L-alanine ligase [Spirochaetia bacterium]